MRNGGRLFAGTSRQDSTRGKRSRWVTLKVSQHQCSVRRNEKRKGMRGEIHPASPNLLNHVGITSASRETMDTNMSEFGKLEQTKAKCDCHTGRAVHRRAHLACVDASSRAVVAFDTSAGLIQGRHPERPRPFRSCLCDADEAVRWRWNGTPIPVPAFWSIR